MAETKTIGTFVKCTAKQYRQLKAGETVNDHTYNPNAIYVTEPEEKEVIVLYDSGTLTRNKKATLPTTLNSVQQATIQLQFGQIAGETIAGTLGTNFTFKEGDILRFTFSSNETSASTSTSDYPLVLETYGLRKYDMYPNYPYFSLRAPTSPYKYGDFQIGITSDSVSTSSTALFNFYVILERVRSTTGTYQTDIYLSKVEVIR